jgi:lipopolysaccharide transport system ATP-binding protein
MQSVFFPATDYHQPPVVSARNLFKKYSRNLGSSLFYAAADMARELILSNGGEAGKHLRKDEFWAAKDISFELRKGEALALIGANGAGKSTILKILCGLIKPDSGEARIRGRVGALIELGAGFDPVLSGKENIYIAAFLLGMKRWELEPLLPKIIEFADIGDFINSPVQFYSSGMKARLSYAIASHMNPDVFLVDEVLAVGDLDFQRKCINHMLHYLSEGGSMILVSHSPYHIQSVCSRGIVLEHGCIIYDGPAVDALGIYIDKHVKHTDPAPRNAGRGDDKLRDSQAAPQTVPASDQAASSTEQSPAEISQDKPLLELSEGHPVEIDEMSIEPVQGQELVTGNSARVRFRIRSLSSFGVIWGATIWSNDQMVCVIAPMNPQAAILEEGSTEVSYIMPTLPLYSGHYSLKGFVLDMASKQALALRGFEDAPLGFRVSTPPSFVSNAYSMINPHIVLNVEADESGGA